MSIDLPYRVARPNRRSVAARVRRFPHVAAIVLTFACIGALIPPYWMLTISVKTSREIGTLPVTLWPETFSLEQFAKVAEIGSMTQAMLNSLLIAAATTLAVVLVGSLTSFALVQLKFRGGPHLLAMSLITQLLPQAASLVPIFMIWSALGLINHLPGIVLAYVAFQLPVAVWIIRGHFASIPAEIIEAAAVDGAKPLRVLLQIVMPMAAPGVAAVAIWCIIGCWSELLFALILFNQPGGTVSIALSSLLGEHSTDNGVVMAGATLATIPPLVLFFVLQKYFQSGLSGAVKG